MPSKVDNPVEKGQIWKSKDSRDNGKLVTVLRADSVWAWIKRMGVTDRGHPFPLVRVSVDGLRQRYTLVDKA